jgi:hypothetical protein
MYMYIITVAVLIEKFTCTALGCMPQMIPTLFLVKSILEGGKAASCSELQSDTYSTYI